ncbi:unnamed protein product [Cunninghamella blakesleeana]
MVLDSVDIICNNTDALIDYMVTILKNIIPISESHEELDKKNKLPKLKQFINNFFEKCKNYVSTSIIIFALLYLKRIKDCIPPNSSGECDTPHRLFIASVLISSKYLWEAGTNLTSKRVSKYTSFIFTYQEINQMERSFLELIKYDLWITKKALEDFLKRYENQLHSQLVYIFLNEDNFISQKSDYYHYRHHKKHQLNHKSNSIQYQSNNTQYQDNHHYHYNRNQQCTTQKAVLNKMIVQKKNYSFESTPPFFLLSPACSSSIRTFSFIKKI